MLKLSRTLLYFILPLSLFVSCNTFDPPLTVPVYGHIDSMHLVVPSDSTRLGTASASIPYVWVYLDDNPVGAFQTPCTFPILANNGVHNIQVYPGVTPVGASSPASIYPFYQFYSININMQKGNTYKIKPVIQYFSWVQFAYMMNFEQFSPGANPINKQYDIINYHGGGNKSGASDTTMIVRNDKKLAYQGNFGMVVVDKKHPYYAGITWPGDKLTFNNTNTPVYVEFNYRATTLFAVGMFDNDTVTQSNPIAIVYPSTGWKKMYVSLYNTIYPSFKATPQHIYFTIHRDTINNHLADTLLLDNIKILY